MDLAPYIRELLINHECFILPDFGGFETSYTSAKYLPENEQMLPPSKSIVFKPEYKIGGEVLTKHLCKKLSIGSDDSNRLIRDYIQDLKSKLRNQQQVLIDGVGIFYPDFAGKPKFEPFENENYLVDSFGLDPLTIYQTQISTPQEGKKIQLKEIAARNTSLSFVIIGVAMISILLIATITLSAKFDIYLFNIGDANQSGREKIIIGGNSNSGNNSYAIEEHIENYTSVKNALSIETDQQISTGPLSTKEYLLVVGSYKSIRNAKELMSRLSAEGYQADIVKSGDSHRVYIGRFTDKSEAIEELSRIRRQINHSVWIFTKEN